MGINLFGFQLGKKDVVVVEDPKQRSFALPTEALDDGAVNITQNAYYGTYVDLEGAVRNEMELITRYREMSNHPELESAISDITNEAISREEDGTIVEINLDNLEVTDNIKKFITGEYKNILSMLNFSNLADDLFKRWYIDGRLYFHVIVNETNPRDGIQELRYIDPRKIRKIREIAKERDNKSGLMIIKSIAEYYVYNERALPEQAFGTTVASPGIKIAPDSIVSVTSGLMDARNAFVVSYLNSAIKPLNQLRMIEDAVVIYRISRAPERRIFYVDVGNLPKGKAEQYLRDVMVKYRNKLVYNQSDGSIVDSRKHLSMLEDFFIPRRDGCFVGSTKIKTLDGRDESLDTLIEEYNNGKENWVYSVSPEGKIVPGKITWAGYTRKNAEILDVYLDNGEIITATPDHKFILRNGTKVEAKDLQPGTSLMPLYTREHFITHNRGSTYLQVKDNIDNKWKFAHRIVGEFIHGPRGKNQILHHIDFDRYNQTPSNLVYMDKLEHFIYHSKHTSAAWEVNKDDHCNKLSISGKAFFETEQGMKRRQEISDNNKVDIRIINGAANGRKKVVELRAIDKANMSHEDYLAKWSPGLTKMAGEMGGQFAKKQVELDKVNLTKEQWDAKYKSRGNTPRVRNYYNLIQNVSLKNISTVFKNELSKNINCNNKILVEKVREHYPTITLETLRDSLKYNGYNSIAEFIYRNIGSEYISNRRLSSINRNIANHSVVKIVHREDRQTVGTLTVDGNNEYHDYHNFALTAGVFVMNSKSTEITTLPGGGALSNLDDIDYFKKKLLQALHVPYSRLEPDGGGLAALGRTTEITRDELKFAKFIDKLRNRFSQLFDSILRIQLSLKGICTQDEWDTFREHIYYDYKKDNNFAELRESELLRERLGTLAQIDPYIGKYYSITWIKKNVLRQSDEEIEEINKEMKVDGSFEILQQSMVQDQPNIQKESFELI